MHYSPTSIIPGPGTGIAPMRALLQERKFRCDAEKRTSKNTLYFGCKKRDVDYLYKDEIEDYVKDKTLSSLHLAFSREQKQKVRIYLNILFQPIQTLL
jgi:NADPH-ferrihemoprotein reductase